MYEVGFRYCLKELKSKNECLFETVKDMTEADQSRSHIVLDWSLWKHGTFQHQAVLIVIDGGNQNKYKMNNGQSGN